MIYLSNHSKQQIFQEILVYFHHIRTLPVLGALSN